MSERANGEWIQDESGWRCSECGDYLQTFVTPDEVEIKYCSNCGARMEVINELKD